MNALTALEPQHAGLAAAIRDWLDSDEYRATLETEAALVDLMTAIRDCPDEDRHDALMWWVRSPWWDAPLMLLDGWQGRLARDAYGALERARDADCPGKRWAAADWRVGRASIERLLGLETNRYRSYASAPFRTWIDDDDKTWIAGAIGSPPLITDADALLAWEHFDITDVILWDPRSNETQVAGEAPGEPIFVMPDAATCDGRLTVWGDGSAYFRAWAERRASRAAYRAADRGANPFSKAAGSDLPGALFVGDRGRARLPLHCGASTMVAGPGMSIADLRAAAIRSAGLPQIEGV